MPAANTDTPTSATPASAIRILRLAAVIRVEPPADCTFTGSFCVVLTRRSSYSPTYPARRATTMEARDRIAVPTAERGDCLRRSPGRYQVGAVGDRTRIASDQPAGAIRRVVRHPALGISRAPSARPAHRVGVSDRGRSKRRGPVSRRRHCQDLRHAAGARRGLGGHDHLHDGRRDGVRSGCGGRHGGGRGGTRLAAAGARPA